MELDAELRRTAERQHGLAAVDQAYEHGGSRESVRHRRGCPDWELLPPRVVGLIGAPRTPEQRLMAAVLDAAPGAAASHRSAAALWRLPGFPFGPLEVSRLRGASGRRPALGRLHEPRCLPPSHLAELAGIPVTTVPRTLFDLAATIRPERLERLVDTVVSWSPAVLPSLHDLLGELGRRRRPGIAAMRRVLDDRPIGSVPPESGLEARFAKLLAAAGEPPLRRQVDVGGHDWLGRVDFADLALGLVVEVDGEAYHSRLDRAHDRRREEAMLAAGFRKVVRISDHMVWDRPGDVIALVRRARRELAEGRDDLLRCPCRAGCGRRRRRSRCA